PSRTPGPPPPPTLGQANTEPPKLSREEQRGRGALLQDICKGTKLRKVTQINDRSAPILEKPKGSGGGSYSSGSAAIQPKGGLFQGGVPKLRPVGAKDSSGNGYLPVVCVGFLGGPGAGGGRGSCCVSLGVSAGQRQDPKSHPPVWHRLAVPSPGERGAVCVAVLAASYLPVPDICVAWPSSAVALHRDRAQSHSCAIPDPSLCSPSPQTAPPNRPCEPPAPPPIKPPPSPVSLRTGSGAQGQSLAPPPPPYRQPPGVPNGPSSPGSESAPELPQRHNSLHRKAPGPLRGLAPPPPTAASPSLQSSRPPPPARDPPSRGAAPPPPPPMLRNGGRDAPPPPPPYRLHGPAEPPSRGKPPPPPTRTPAGPPPPPPPVRNGHRDSISTVRAFLDDFESKYSFHPVEDFPAPEEYKYFQRIYPSKTNRATRGAPPLPPIPR
ncbi:WIPF2 protein, partial [Neopipo cinnamomea]|nr:WIPF2 protein [Neopipo cinnamomea]